MTGREVSRRGRRRRGRGVPVRRGAMSRRRTHQAPKGRRGEGRGAHLRPVMPAAGGPPEAACRVQPSRTGSQQAPDRPEGQGMPGPGMATPVQSPGQPGQRGAVPEGDDQTAGRHATGFAQCRGQGGGRQFVGPQQHPVEAVVVKGQPVRGRGFDLHALRGPVTGLFPQGRRGLAGAQVEAALPERGQDMPRAAAGHQQFPAPARPGASMESSRAVLSGRAMCWWNGCGGWRGMRAPWWGSLSCYCRACRRVRQGAAGMRPPLPQGERACGSGKEGPVDTAQGATSGCGARRTSSRISEGTPRRRGKPPHRPLPGPTYRWASSRAYQPRTKPPLNRATP